MVNQNGKYPLRFFIVGSQRTGTTLIRLILECHPKVFCYDEGLSYGLLRDKVFGLPPDMRKDPGAVERIGYKIPRWTEQLGRPMIVDNIDHEGATAFYLGEPIIFLHRDVRDTVASMLTLITDGGNWVKHWARRMIEDKIANDLQFKDKFRREIDLVTSLQWPDAAAGALCWKYKTSAYWEYCDRGYPVLGLRYEDLVQHPERELRRVAAFLSIEWDEALLRHNKFEHQECSTGSAIGGTDPTAAISSRSLNRYQQVLPSSRLTKLNKSPAD